MSDADIHDERLQHLQQLITLVENRCASDYEFKHATGSLAGNLTFISDALRQNAGIWRMNRAFHTVHVPSFLAVMAMLDGIDNMASVCDDEKHQIYGSINRAAQLAALARERIEQAALTEAKVELNLLANYAPEQPEEYKKASLFQRTRDGILSASNTTLQKAKSGVESLPGLVETLKGGVGSSLERVTAVPLLVVNLQKSLAGAFSDSVTKPIAMRLHASGKAITHGTGAGIGLGVVAAVLFPPLIPISAGGGILVAMRSWRTEMQKAQTLGQQEREHRIAELRKERAAALQQLTNGAPSVQMETEDLSLTLDTETGEADAIVLTGENAGRAWSDLSPLEKMETASLFASSADLILKILEFGGEGL